MVYLPKFCIGFAQSHGILQNSWIGVVIGFLVGCAGFVNVLIYYVIRKKKPKAHNRMLNQDGSFISNKVGHGGDISMQLQKIK